MDNVGACDDEGDDATDEMARDTLNLAALRAMSGRTRCARGRVVARIAVGVDDDALHAARVLAMGAEHVDWLWIQILAESKG